MTSHTVHKHVSRGVFVVLILSNLTLVICSQQSTQIKFPTDSVYLSIHTLVHSSILLPVHPFVHLFVHQWQ